MNNEYTFAFNRSVQQNFLFVVLDLDLVRSHFQVCGHLLQKLIVFHMCNTSLSEIGRSMNNRLLLVLVQDARYDGLSGHSESFVVNDNSAQGVQTVQVEQVQRLDSLEIVDGRHISGMITAQVLVVILDVEAQAEEHVVPDEHLYFGLLARIDRHDVVLDDELRASSRRVHEIAVHLEHGALADQSLGQGLLGQFACGLDLLVPVARVAWDMVLVAEFGRVRVLGAEPVHRVLKVRREPREHLVGCADSLERMLLGAFALYGGEVALETRAQHVEQINQRVADLVRVVLFWIEQVIGAPLEKEIHKLNFE
jgi:hypothetical protein